MDVINTNKLDVDKIVNIKNKQNKVLYSDIIKKDKENYTDNYNYSDSLTSNIKKVLNITKNNDEDNLIKIKEQLQKKYIELSKIDKNNWADSIEIEDIENEINILELKEIDSGNMKIPNIKLTINGINYDGDKLIIESIKNKTNSLSKNDEKISILINDMENYFADFNNKMKQIIGDKINNDYFKIILFNNLNKIGSEIELFKNNYKDIVKYN
jgi:hypothetical protein